MACCNQIIATNAGGIPYIVSTNTTVGTETINIALGVRRIQPVGYLTIIISTVIPADATGYSARFCAKRAGSRKTT